ncbi:hypothetical protein [Actinoplanes sp. GCM10030250]|uniref:hypothetical protein n=1 Tax=Actinoplanes sp. GCM10030250 TaxID=3273376 RepID=UPI003611578D
MVPAAGTILLTTLLGGGPAVAAAPAMIAERAAGAVVCRVKDKRLVEISGLVTDGTGYVVVNDGADDAAGRRIFFLDRRCKVKRAVSYPSRPRDAEDLARGPDGTLWVADIGDNGRSRTTIALWRLAPGAKKPELHRMSYPDGAHDAEALLISGDGTPVIVTKDPLTAGMYVPTGELRADATTPLRRAGDAAVPMTSTSNPFGLPGHLVITGGATSADGRRVVLRTYADAFEYDVPDGDPVRAISEGTPRAVALPDEPQGESVAYSEDGRSLLTISEVTEGSAGGAGLLRYPLPDSPAAAATRVPAAAPEAEPVTPSTRPVAATPPSGFPAGAAVAGGVLAVAAAALGIIVARRRRTS